VGSGADLELHGKAEIDSPCSAPGIGAPQVSNWASLLSFRVQYRRQRSEPPATAPNRTIPSSCGDCGIRCQEQ